MPRICILHLTRPISSRQLCCPNSLIRIVDVSKIQGMFVIHLPHTIEQNQKSITAKHGM